MAQAPTKEKGTFGDSGRDDRTAAQKKLFVMRQRPILIHYLRTDIYSTTLTFFYLILKFFELNLKNQKGFKLFLD